MKSQKETVKKTYNLPPKLLARAKRILGAKTETETIVRSLEEVAFLDNVEKALRKTAGKAPDFQTAR